MAAGSYLVALYSNSDDDDTTTTMAPEDSFDLSVVCGDGMINPLSPCSPSTVHVAVPCP